MKWIAPSRVERAILALSEWSRLAQSQTAQHLFPLVAFLQAGARPGQTILYKESDDYNFYDRYLRLSEGGDQPYFDPLTLGRRIATHPHSNVATARKGTFARSWGAADFDERSGGEPWWTLSEDWASKVERKVLKKGKSTTRVPALDLAVLLYREREWDDDASARTVEREFRDSLKIGDEDYDRLFVYRDEEPQHLFVDEKPAMADVQEAILATLLPSLQETSSLRKSRGSEALDRPTPLDEDDPILLEVRELLALNTSGIIFRGVPGVGKTWRAHQIALALVGGDEGRVRRVQFHPAYSYENFVEGYVPDSGSTAGFKPIGKVFLDVCGIAQETGLAVLVIDEINRGDPARVFGEALTYIERGYRGEPFTLTYSGDPAQVPSGLLILGTMNPYDRSIAQLDAAFVRRFDHITIPVSEEAATGFLERTGAFTPRQVDIVIKWFSDLQALIPEGLGHAYFKDVRRPEDIAIVWRYRMLPACRAALEFEAASALDTVERDFAKMQAELFGQPAAE